jgi:hypothetical protein
MDAKPIILPLNLEGSIYAIQDEKGATLGTGTREVCEALLHILINQCAVPSPIERRARIAKENTARLVNIRSAIAI